MKGTDSLQDRLPKFRAEQLREAVSEEYRKVAINPGGGFHFNMGRPLAEKLGYEPALLDGVPESSIEAFAGVGNPFSMGLPALGERVADLGSGSGMDALIAARLVGTGGTVTGIDMTREMRERATGGARQMGAENVSFVGGLVEDQPLPDDSMDLVISNGVINLCLDKHAAFAETHRVLKPGGRLQIADVLLDRPVSPVSRDLIFLWAECVAGGIPADDYTAAMRAAGFEQVEVVNSYDVFRDAAVAPKAEEYGARGYDIRAVKPG